MRDCWRTSDCGDFVACADPGNTSASGDPRFRWVRCRDCGDRTPISRETGRMVSFVING